MSRWRKLLRRRGDEPLPVADLMRFEPLARRRLSQMAYDYVRSGGGDEISMRENRAGFERLRLAPNVLTDVSKLDTRVTLFGSELEHPILLAPVAYHRLYHPDGEIATARGASAAGAAFVISSFTTTAIDEIKRNTDQPIWFQLYVQRRLPLRPAFLRTAQQHGVRASARPGAEEPYLSSRDSRS